jgi:hypothetical protein
MAAACQEVARAVPAGKVVGDARGRRADMGAGRAGEGRLVSQGHSTEESPGPDTAWLLLMLLCPRRIRADKSAVYGAFY